MEKYMSNMRIILCANSTSKLIAPIKSRCLLVRVAAPTPEEVCNELSGCPHPLTSTYTTCYFKMGEVLAYVAKKERFDLPPDAAQKIIEDSNGNMRKAILVLEALKMQT